MKKPSTSLKGVFIRLAIILLWLASLFLFLSIDATMIPLSGIVSAMLLQTFFYTGLCSLALTKN